MKFVATYTDGRNIKRKPFPAESKSEAYETAIRRTPRGYKLCHLRQSSGRRRLPAEKGTP